MFLLSDAGNAGNMVNAEMPKSPCHFQLAPNPVLPDYYIYLNIYLNYRDKTYLFKHIDKQVNSNTCKGNLN